MDLFEKQQTIEAIKTIIKARWFYISIIGAQAAIVKLLFPAVPLPNSFMLSLIIFAILLINLGYWTYLRRCPENISDLSLRFIKISQVPMEVLGITATLYFSGTANKLLIIAYVIPIMVSSIFYNAKWVIVVTFGTVFIYVGLVIFEYYGLLPSVPPEAAAQSPYKLLGGNLTLTTGQIMGFTTYILAASIYAAYLASIFIKREKKLVLQKEELLEKTKTLTANTQEITQTKDWLHESLAKSDKERLELVKTKQVLEKTNAELNAKIEELERFNQVTVGREQRMMELKEEIKKLKEMTKKPGT